MFNRESGFRRLPVWLALALCAAAALPADTVKRISGEQAMSAAISKPNPQYPEVAKQMKVEGSVELKVTIGEDGAVQEAVAVTGNPLLSRAAIDGVKKWKFKPFKEDGKGVRVVTNFSLGFKL